MSFKKRLFSVMLAVASSACVAVSFSACGNGKYSDKLSFLTVDKQLVINAEGEEVSLRGVNAGGLFVTEHWMTGFAYGTSDSDDYRSLTKTFIDRFGVEETKALWEEYRANWWSEADFKNCADMGMNVIRLPFTYMNVDFAAVLDYDDAGQDYDFTALDEFVEGAAKYGMYTILDLHGAYGSQNGQDHSGQIMNSASEVDFYSNTRMMELTAQLWGALAEHYKDNPAVAAYDILNEPGEKAGLTSERHWAFYDKVYRAIREEDENHIVIFESCWEANNLPKTDKYGWKNCMYSFHHYAGDKLSEENFNANWSAKLASIEKANFGIPLQMGEFTCYSNAHNWEYVLGLLNRSGWHWTSWTYKVWREMPWGIVNIIASNADKINAREDSYEQILQKFKKLKTGGENAKEYMFYTSTDGEDYKEYKTLAQIFGEYCPVEAKDE